MGLGRRALNLGLAYQRGVTGVIHRYKAYLVYRILRGNYILGPITYLITRISMIKARYTLLHILISLLVKLIGVNKGRLVTLKYFNILIKVHKEHD